MRLLVEAADLLQESLTLGGLSSDRAEALDAEGLAGLDDSSGPLGDLALGGGGGTLLGDDPAVLVLLEGVLLETTNGLDLAALEHLALAELCRVPVLCRLPNARCSESRYCTAFIGVSSGNF